MTRVLFTVLITSLGFTMWTGCAAGKQKRVEAELKNAGAVDCSTARGDLRMLNQEKANVAQRVVEGVTSVYPAGLVIGVLTGTEGEKVKVATGEYNKMIDQRIALIKQTCGIQ